MKRKNKETIKSEKVQSPSRQIITMNPDPDKKKSIAAYLVESKKKLHGSIFVGNILFISGLAVAIGYILLNFAINSWSISYISGQPVKDYVGIVTTGLMYFGVGAVVAAVIRITAATMTGKYIKERIDERAEFDGETFRFIYGNKKKQWRKKVFEMALGSPENCGVHMSYDPKTARIDFRGDLKAKEVDPSAKAGEKVATGTVKELVVYDYFSPSIHMILKRHGYQFEEPDYSDDKGAKR